MKLTQKQYWIKEVGALIFLMGVNFAREYYIQHIIPKQTIKILQNFYFEWHKIDMLYKFRMINADLDMLKIRDVNGRHHKNRQRLVRKYLKR